MTGSCNTILQLFVASKRFLEEENECFKNRMCLRMECLANFTGSFNSLIGGNKKADLMSLLIILSPINVI